METATTPSTLTRRNGGVISIPFWPFGGSIQRAQPYLTPRNDEMETTDSRSSSSSSSTCTATNGTIEEYSNQQQHQMERGEHSICSSCCSSIARDGVVLSQQQQQHLLATTTTATDDESSFRTRRDVSSNCGSSCGITTTPTSKTTTYSGWYCTDLINAIVSRSFYSISSISMILMNKSIDQSYHHYVDGDLSILFIIFQSMIVLGCIESCRQFDHRTTAAITTTTTNSGNRQQLYRPTVMFRATVLSQLGYTTTSSSISILSGLFFSVMLVTSMFALHYNTLSMIIVSRNAANLVLLLGDYIAFGKFPDVYVATIYNVLLTGAIIAALKQQTFSVSRAGLFWMIANCLGTSGYILCMKHFLTTTTQATTSTSSCVSCNNTNSSSCSCSSMCGPSPPKQQSPPPVLSSSVPTSKLMIFGIIFVNNVMCIAFLLPTAYMMGEITLFVESTAIHTTEYACKTILAGFLCFVFNYSILTCVEQQSIVATNTMKHHHSVTTDSCNTSQPNQLLHQQRDRRPSLSERRTKKKLLL